MATAAPQPLPRPHGAPRLARVLRVAAVGLGCALGALAGAFAAGEALDDPGGLAGVGLVALWLVPLAALVALAARRPAAAERVLVALVGALLALAVLRTLAPGLVHDVEDAHGPVRAIALLALVPALAVLGRTRPLHAGGLLLAAALVPLALGGGAALGAVALPAALVGLLLVLAGLAGRGR